jgi:hypothetical protein
MSGKVNSSSVAFVVTLTAIGLLIFRSMGFSLYSLCLFGVGGVPLAAATAATIDVLTKK